jgi:hypothetical protein
MNLATNRYGPRVGERIGSLTFIGIAGKRDINKRVFGSFKCDCGTLALFPAGRVLDGKKKTHCGCQTDWNAPKSHGMRYAPEYSSWVAMKARCLNPDNKDFPRWGGKGISICQEWIESFEAFYKHLGPRPEGTTLERKDGTKGYEPGNVYWGTSSEQARNRTSSFIWFIKDIRFESAEEAASYFSVSDTTIHRWTKGFHDKRRGTTTPPKENCRAVRRY